MDEFQSEKYERALKRVKELKGFYSHLRVYIMINLVIIVMGSYIIGRIKDQNRDLDFNHWLDWNLWITPILWGVGLAIHALHTYRHKLRLFRSWEERKIKELMEKDQENFTDGRWE